MSEPTPLPAIADSPLSVVLVADNEQAHVDEVLTNWLTHLNRLGRSYELIVVDDGSTDRTREIAEGLAKRHASLRVLHHPTRRGSGAALRTGIQSAQYPLLLYATCDRQYQPGELRLLLAEIDRVHLVSGFRRWQPMPRWLRRLGICWRMVARILFSMALEPLPGWLGWKGHAHQWLVRIFFGVRLLDPGCSFRLFRRFLFARIPIQTNGAFAQDEIVAKANFLGAVMTDVPVSYRPRPDRPAEGFWRLLKQAQRVFSYPDFGPPRLPGNKEWTMALAAGSS